MSLISIEPAISHANDLWNTVSRLHSHLKGRTYVLLSPINKLLGNSAGKMTPYLASFRQILAPLGKEAPFLCGSLTALSVVTDNFFHRMFEKTRFIKSSNNLKTSTRLLVNFCVLKSVVSLTALPMNNIGISAVVVLAMAINAVWKHLEELQDNLNSRCNTLEATLNTQTNELKEVKNLSSRLVHSINRTNQTMGSFISTVSTKIQEIQNEINRNNSPSMNDLLKKIASECADLTDLVNSTISFIESNNEKNSLLEKNITDLVNQLDLWNSLIQYLQNYKKSLMSKTQDFKCTDVPLEIPNEIKLIEEIENKIASIISTHGKIQTRPNQPQKDFSTVNTSSSSSSSILNLVNSNTPSDD